MVSLPFLELLCPQDRMPSCLLPIWAEIPAAMGLTTPCRSEMGTKTPVVLWETQIAESRRDQFLTIQVGFCSLSDSLTHTLSFSKSNSLEALERNQCLKFCFDFKMATLVPDRFQIGLTWALEAAEN